MSVVAALAAITAWLQVILGCVGSYTALAYLCIVALKVTDLLIQASSYYWKKWTQKNRG